MYQWMELETAGSLPKLLATISGWIEIPYSPHSPFDAPALLFDTANAGYAVATTIALKLDIGLVVSMLYQLV